MQLFSIPPEVPFLDTLAAWWLAEAGDDPWRASEGLILLPTRRAARALAEAFLRQSRGRPLLLPRIAALGAPDDAPLALAGALDLPPAVDPAVRLAVLTRLILALDGQGGAPTTADRAWKLAAELAHLLDESARAEIDLPAALRDLPVGEFATHWQTILTFLRIVTGAWPDFLTEGDLIDGAARQVKLLHGQARAWEDSPPPHKIWAAGTTGGIPAVARLLGVVARMPRGRVILPGLDLEMDDTAWQALDEAHPQIGLRRLLAGLGAERGDVVAHPAPSHPAQGPPGRAALLSRALLPAAALSAWRDRMPAATAGIRLMRPADQQEEAVAIALALRDAIEQPGHRAALVTPDRDLAVRVAAELLRFGVVADDSAGERVAQTPPAHFLRLLAQAVAERFPPIPLLSLLKHPLAAAGLSPVACREAARGLERACLRGPRPAPGLDGLRRVAELRAAPSEALDLLDRLERCLAPLIAATAAERVAPADLFAALVAAGEALAATDEDPGPARLWAAEDGEALAVLLAGLQQALAFLPPQPADVLPGLVDAVLEGAMVRSRRALRGRGGAEHPRVFIWGLLEARLQAAEFMVLGGLAETVWPPATDPGPWLSRPMRGEIGLPSPEEIVGQSAHDFVMACCAAPEVVLSCPRRRDGAPAVPARWITRLEAYLQGQDAVLAPHPAVRWARALDLPAGRPRPVAPPHPRPAVALRPRQLSVTEVETWLRDPYAIYARHILRLRQLDAIDQSTDAADYGSVVHAGLHRFLAEVGAAWPDQAASRLRAAMDAALGAAGLRPALYAWWRPRLHRIADWVALTEALRRSTSPPLHVQAEVSGKWEIPAPAGPFVLTGRADRIERRADDHLAILDYKTGSIPTQRAVDVGLAPQLPLEGIMAELGAFGPDLQGPVTELTYWGLPGGFEAGREQKLSRGVPELVAEATDQARWALADLVAAYDDPARPYLSRPDPAAAPRFSEFAQLARAAEWLALEEGE